MQGISDALAEEFAGKAALIHQLKLSDAHFARLLDENEKIYREIQRVQANITPAEDEALETLEKTRLHLLDQIAAMLAAAERG